MDMPPPFEIYIDESGVPFFKPMTESLPYVVCAIAIPITKKQKVLEILPRSADGILLKSSSIDSNDDSIALFLNSILNYDIFISLVGVNTTSKKNTNMVNTLVERANMHRRKRIRQPSLVYALAIKQALINVWGYGKIDSFNLILDSNNLPRNEFILLKEILETKFAKRDVRIQSISQETEQAKPLLLAADIIAGVARRWDSHQDVPKSWKVIETGLGLNKIFIENGFELYNLDS